MRNSKLTSSTLSGWKKYVGARDNKLPLCFIPNILWWQQKHSKNIHWNSQSNVLLIRYNQMNSSSKLFLTPRKYDFSREKVKNEKTTFVYLQPFKKSENSVDKCLWGQALSSFSISKSLIITCDLHTAYSTVHFRNHHPLWLFHWIIFYSSLCLPLSKLQKGLILQPLENRPSGVFPTSHFRTSYLCFSLVSREVVMTTCRFQRLSCELNLQRSFFRSSSVEPVNR